MPRGMGRTYTWIDYDDPSNSWLSWWDSNSQSFKNHWEDGERPERDASDFGKGKGQGGLQESQRPRNSNWPRSSNWNSWENQQWYDVSGGLQESQRPRSSYWNPWEDQQWHDVSGGLQESRQKGHKGNRGRRQGRSQSVKRKGKGWKSGKGKEEKGQRQRSRRPSLNRKGKGSKSEQGKAKGKTSGLEESQNATEHPIGRWKQLKEQEKNLLEQRKEELDQRERANAHWEDLNEEVQKKIRGSGQDAKRNDEKDKAKTKR